MMKRVRADIVRVIANSTSHEQYIAGCCPSASTGSS